MSDGELLRLHERIDEIAQPLADLRGDIRELLTRMDALGATVARHDQDLHGNGRDGLLTRVHAVELNVGELRNRSGRWYWAVVGFGLSAVLALLAAGAQWLVLRWKV
jgi:hypothetical protein